MSKPITPVKPGDIPIDKAKLRKLYQDIGGEKRLGEVLEVFYERMSHDVLIGFFFDGRDIRDIASKQKLFLMRAMDAIPSYSGKPPALAHLELPPILPGHFDRRLRILEETLRDQGLSDEDIRIWLGLESAFRNAIVTELD